MRCSRAAAGELVVPLVTRAEGSHARLLSLLAEAVRPPHARGRRPRLDGAPARRGLGTRHPGSHGDASIAARGASAIRGALEEADALGAPVAELHLDGRVHPLALAPLCPGCGRRVPTLQPSDFRTDREETAAYRLGGLTLDLLLALPVAEARPLLAGLDLAPGATRAVGEVTRRLEAIEPSASTTSRSTGRCRRCRAARRNGSGSRSCSPGRLEDLLHVLDEPTIGLHHSDLRRLLEQVSRLPGPVLMVEHDPLAVAMADESWRSAPAAARAGGRLVFQGTPADAVARRHGVGHGFSRRGPSSAAAPANWTRPRIRRHAVRACATSAASTARSRSAGSRVVTGPSGAGKTTLVRDVLLASLQAGGPVGCAAFDGAGAPCPSPWTSRRSGNNPRSNPATYTKVLDRIRDVFANETGRAASEFTFNRAEGACPDVRGDGRGRAISHELPGADLGDRARPATAGATGPRSSRATAGGSLDRRRAGADASTRPARSFASTAAVTRILAALAGGRARLPDARPAVASLSGGEAQRVRLAREVAKARTGDLVVARRAHDGSAPRRPRPAARGARPADGQRLHGDRRRAPARRRSPPPTGVIDLGPGRRAPMADACSTAAPPVAEKQPRVRRAPSRARGRRSATPIRVRGARAHNLQRRVDVDFAQGPVHRRDGVSGSGKSSLVRDVVEAEATRRLLECLSVYERQSVREGPEAPVDSLDRAGPDDEHRRIRHDLGSRGPRRYTWDAAGRPSAGPATSPSARRRSSREPVSARALPAARDDGAGRHRSRKPRGRAATAATEAVPIEPRHLLGSTGVACLTCLGLGVVPRVRGRPADRATRTSRSAAARCLGRVLAPATCAKPRQRRQRMLQALGGALRVRPVPDAVARAERRGPHAVPVRRRRAARGASGRRSGTATVTGAASDAGAGTSAACTRPCPCAGVRRQAAAAEYLAMQPRGTRPRRPVLGMPLAELDAVLASIDAPDDRRTRPTPAPSPLRRLGFLVPRRARLPPPGPDTATLSAGEAQRHQAGVGARRRTGRHDRPARRAVAGPASLGGDRARRRRWPSCATPATPSSPSSTTRADPRAPTTSSRSAPAPGRAGGRVVDRGQPAVGRRARVTRWALAAMRRRRRPPRADGLDAGHRRPRENNLAGDDVARPARRAGRRLRRVRLGQVVARRRHASRWPGAAEDRHVGRGVIRVRARRPRRHRRRARPDGRRRPVPRRDHLARRCSSGSSAPFRKAFAAPRTAVAAGLTMKDSAPTLRRLQRQRAWQSRTWAFLPSVPQTCDACGGYRLSPPRSPRCVGAGRSLADIEALTIDELRRRVGRHRRGRARACDAAVALGLGYLVVRQPGWSLSGGEAQRLKLAKELARPTKVEPTLYVLDEPTVGLQRTDVAVLAAALDALVDAGNTRARRRARSAAARCLRLAHRARAGRGPGRRPGRPSRAPPEVSPRPDAHRALPARGAAMNVLRTSDPAARRPVAVAALARVPSTGGSSTTRTTIPRWRAETDERRDRRELVARLAAPMPGPTCGAASCSAGSPTSATARATARPAAAETIFAHQQPDGSWSTARRRLKSGDRRATDDRRCRRRPAARHRRRRLRH